MMIGRAKSAIGTLGFLKLPEYMPIFLNAFYPKEDGGCIYVGGFGVGLLIILLKINIFLKIPFFDF